MNELEQLTQLGIRYRIKQVPGGIPQLSKRAHRTKHYDRIGAPTRGNTTLVSGELKDYYRPNSKYRPVAKIISW